MIGIGTFVATDAKIKIVKCAPTTVLKGILSRRREMSAKTRSVIIVIRGPRIVDVDSRREDMMYLLKAGKVSIVSGSFLQLRA